MKKIFYSLIIFLSLFIFINKAEALQCLYESKDGDRVVLDQYDSGWPDNYKAVVYTLDEVTIGGKTFDNSWTSKVYNDLERINEWLKVDSCPKKLLYNESSGEDEVYADCCSSKEYYEKFYLVEGYAGPSPQYVGLNEFFCTYEFVDSSNFTYTYSFLILVSTVVCHRLLNIILHAIQ